MIENFELFAGDDKVLRITVVDTANAVVDITDFLEIRWKMARTVHQSPLLEKSLNNGIVIVNGGSGRYDIVLNSPDTEAMRQGDYYHEAECIDEDGNVATVMIGTITILPTLIKPESP